MTEKDARSNETPLESWKEIASYLKRDVRTVKRWEKSERLPVRRHLHQARASVYAYPSELDAWRAQRKPGAGPLSGWLGLAPVRALAATATLVLALLTAASGPILTPASAAAEPDGMTARQVWDQGDATGSPSPDGRYLSYVNWLTANIAVRDLETGASRDLTDEGTWEGPDQFGYYSVWSPDGTQIAYAWFNKDIYELRTVGLDGEKPRVLYRNPEMEWIRAHDWSEDGKSILALLGRKDRTNQIVLVSVSDGSVRVLKTLDWRRPLIMTLSPDGAAIAYDLVPDEDADLTAGRDIYVLATDGSGESVLVGHPANDYGPVWTPSGKRIVFASDRAGSTGAWMVEVADGRPSSPPRVVRRALGRMFPMTFTRDGSLFYGYANFENGGNIYFAQMDPDTGSIVAPPVRAIQRFEGENTSGSWSPDGKYLAYLSRRGSSPFGAGSWGIRIRSLETGKERELTPDLRRLRNYRYAPPQWSPDGRHLLAAGVNGKGRWAHFRIDVETAKADLMIQKPELGEAFRPAWSRDGKTIFFRRLEHRNGALVSSIVGHDVETGREEVLYRGEITGLAVSPSGAWLAFFEGEEQNKTLKLLPTGAGELREVYSAPPAHIPYSVGLAWSPDEKYLYWNQNVNTENPEQWPDVPVFKLCRVSAEGGELEELEIQSEVMRDIAIHPDGRRISFTAGGAGKAEVWVLENFLPTPEVAQAEK